jgi:hypothetical protein
MFVMEEASGQASIEQQYSIDVALRLQSSKLIAHGLHCFPYVA